jgi:hypothetical protein
MFLVGTHWNEASFFRYFILSYVEKWRIVCSETGYLTLVIEIHILHTLPLVSDGITITRARYPISEHPML